MKTQWEQTFDTQIYLDPIGVVENDFNEPSDQDTIRTAESRIILRSDLHAALEGMEPGQKLLVIYFFHRSEPGPLLQHPRGDENRPKRGVFMLRTPSRPNPIGVTQVDLIEIDRNVLRVRGLDAIHGSPVIDIKPA